VIDLITMGRQWSIPHIQSFRKIKDLFELVEKLKSLSEIWLRNPTGGTQ